jgi:DNA processing protein
VLPTPFERPFPAWHAGLFDRIAERGARVTERASTDTPHASHFLERNRIIAALSRVVVIAQAPFRSGALRTAADARALEVPVLAVPWAPTERAAVGGLALLANGATLCRDANDVLAALGEPTVSTKALRRPRPRARGDDAALLAVLDELAVDRDTAFGRAGLDARRGQAALTRLVMNELVHEDLLGVRRR